jgi:hypothetical protein
MHTSIALLLLFSSLMNAYALRSPAVNYSGAVTMLATAVWPDTLPLLTVSIHQTRSTAAAYHSAAYYYY